MQARRGRPNGRAAATCALVAVLLVVGAAPAPAQARPYRARLLDMINHSRDVHGLDPVKLNVQLSGDARHHTRKMIRRDRLFDVRNLAELLDPYNWEFGGNVVGCGAGLYRVHRALMRHGAHRDIILSPDARRVGIGVVMNDGKSSCGRDAFWVTEIFYG